MMGHLLLNIHLVFACMVSLSDKHCHRYLGTTDYFVEQIRHLSEYTSIYEGPPKVCRHDPSKMLFNILSLSKRWHFIYSCLYDCVPFRWNYFSGFVRNYVFQYKILSLSNRTLLFYEKVTFLCLSPDFRWELYKCSLWVMSIKTIWMNNNSV